MNNLILLYRYITIIKRKKNALATFFDFCILVKEFLQFCFY